MHERDVLFTGLVVYNLNNPLDRTNLNIHPGISNANEEFVWASNYSNFVLELRVGTPTGEKLATLAPNQINQAIPLVQNRQGNHIMPYEFYPTYVYVNPQTNEISSFASRGRVDRERATPSATVVIPMRFEGPGDTSQISFLVSFFRINNQTNQGINLRDGGRWLFDQKGMPLVGSGQVMVYELDSTSGERGQPYTNLILEFDRAGEFRVDPFYARPGVVYELLVTQNPNGHISHRIRELERRNILDELQMQLLLGG